MRIFNRGEETSQSQREPELEEAELPVVWSLCDGAIASLLRGSIPLEVDYLPVEDKERLLVPVIGRPGPEDG
jgi:hypothetical protein